MRYRLCFPETNALKRTHESFKNKSQEQYHLVNTTMTKLINIPNLNIIQNIFFGLYVFMLLKGNKKTCLFMVV